VGLTGVIYGAIVVAWAAYLVPLALRRHDEVARSRSVDRFSSAMRVLSRRGESTAGRLVVTPPRAVDRIVSPSLKRPAPAATFVGAARPNREALRTAAARRRRVLVGLLLLTAAVGAIAAAGRIPLWSAGIPVALVAGFLCLARHQVRAASDSYWREVAVAPAPSNVIRRTPTRVEASHGAAKDADDEDTVPLDIEDLKKAAALLEPERNVAVPLPTADGGSLWDPLPITLPTYVDKPVAARTIRTVDLGAAGTSSGHKAPPTQTASGASSAGAARAGDKEAGAEPARVVNG
jgi:hypothetical protein